MKLNVLQNFSAISLADLQNQAPLMNRQDRKFVFPLSLLDQVLKDCTEEYVILKIGEKLIFDYKTNYYDTKDLHLYHSHHNGIANRYKIRERRYVDSGLNFIEVKSKTNKGQTIKSRIEANCISQDESFVENQTGLNVDDLEKTLEIDYSRITLLHKKEMEKVTLDINLTFQRDDKFVELDAVCIAEVKTEKAAANHFLSIMKKYGLRELSVSKYCFGLISLNDEIKYNNFKYKYNKILKINNSD